MMLCMEAPEVLKLPEVTRHLMLPPASDGFISDGSPRVVCNTDEPPREKLIKVCVSICNQYLFVLTSQVLHVYSNLHSNAHVGRFTLDDEQYQRFGEFRDIVLIPGWRNFCLLMEKHKKVLVCTYDISQLGLDALVDFDIQRQSSMSNFGSPRNDGSVASSSNSLNMTQLRVQPKAVPEPISRRRSIGNYESMTIASIRQQYERIFEPVDIKVLYILALPAGVHSITVHDAQMYFWTVEHAGVYVTLCPEGFTNYLGCNVTDEMPIRIDLNLHATNLVRNLVASGTVSLSRGLCYLTFKDSLYTNAMSRKTGEINLYVLDNTTGGTINCLGDWVTRSCSSTTNSSIQKHRRDSVDFDLKAIRADALLSDMEDSVAPGKTTLDEIIGSMCMEDVVMITERNTCLITTKSGTLMSLNIDRVSIDHIGQVIYKNGVSKIATDGRALVACVNGQVTLLSWHDNKIIPMWSYKMTNIRSVAVYNHVIAALYNHDGLLCLNVLGKMLLHRRCKIDDQTAQSSCFAARGLAIMATRASKLVMYRFYSTGYNDVHCSNPLNNVITFVGSDDILLFHARMIEGTFGVASKPMTEDRHLHSYDNDDLISDMDCGLFTLPITCLQSKTGKWPITRALPSPNGSYLLCSTSNGFTMYTGFWEWFGDDLGECAAMGWLNDQVCFLVVNMPMQVLITNRNTTLVDDSGNNVISLGDAGTSYCHFFHVSNLRECIEFIPLKHRPICCTVYEETLYIMDETLRITGYEICNLNGGYKFDIVYQMMLQEPSTPLSMIREIHCLDRGIFVVLDQIDGLYRIQDGKCTKILEGCSYITPTVRVVDGQQSVVLLCSIRFKDKLVMVTSKQRLIIRAQLPPATLVDEGVITYLINLMDPDNNVQKIRIGKMPLPSNDMEEALNGPVYMDVLDKIISNVTAEDNKANKEELCAEYEQLPVEVKWRLIARQSRKRNLREEVKELEEMFKCSLQDIFDNMLQCGRESEASFMLLALQSITDPNEVRNKYNVRLLQILARQLATSMTKEDTLHLFQALLRFHHLVDDVETIDIKAIALEMLRECNIMAVYKLCQLFNVQLSWLVQALREELEEMYHWGICIPPSGESSRRLTHRTVDEYSDTVGIANMIVTLKMKLSLTGETKGTQQHVRDAEVTARANALMSQGIVESKVMPYAGEGICSHFFDAFLAERLFVPAAAIAIASADFVAISQLMLMDQETSDIIGHLLTQSCECDKCESKFEMIKHCLLSAKKRFAN